MFKKIKGHYAERKQSQRDVISYEDMPLDDYEQEKTDISPEAVKKIIIGVCIALATGLIVFAFSNRDKLTWDNISNWWTYDVLGSAGNGYPVDLIGTEVQSGNFSVNQGHIAYASDTSFVTLNSTGNEVANIQLRYSKPVMKSSGNRFITYGIGSKDYQIQNFDGMIYSGETDSAIYTADISSNGVYGIVTDGNGYTSVLYVFNKDNNRIYKYSFSEYYINSISLNSDGTACLACGITSDNGAMKTGVYVLDFTKEKPVSQYSISSDTIIECEYLNDSRAVLVGQAASYTVTPGSEKYGTVNYNSKTLTNYCFNPDTNSFALALSKSGDGRSCVIEIYNDNGEKVHSVNSNSGAESISLYKDTIAVLDGNTAYGFDGEGNKLFTCETGSGSKRLILTSNTSGYVLSVNQIRFFDFTKSSTKDTVN